MDATQMISDSILESDEEENEDENKDERGQPLAKLCILKNEHIPAAVLPLFLGDNVLGRDPNTCTLPLPAPSISKQHATICISEYRRRGSHSEVDMEALVWDLGSMNGTRKGRLKLTPNVRYALGEGDSLLVADIPCRYVSCAVDSVSSQGEMRTPVSRNSGVKAKLPDVSTEKVSNTSTGSKKCVNGGTKPSSLDLEDTRTTPARTTCLSFEQTPTQPQGTLVPESDSDSDGERGGREDGRRKPLVSDCDSHKSSPTCSTFLSPTNKIVPESEDESPITPSSSTKNRPYRHVSFSKEESDIDVGRQQLKKKETLAIADSEEEEGREEERATPGGMALEESGQDVLVKQESNVSITRDEELPVSTRAVSTDVIPAFNMDSDTDVEGEEESVTSEAAVTLNANQKADQPPNTVQFHMDSDTDIDEDEDTFVRGPKSVPFSDDDKTNPPHSVPVIQPEGITMDSDTDVDDDADMSDAAAKAKPTAHTADSAPSTQPKDFHLDSDTDVDEEEENEGGTNNTRSKVDQAPTRIDSKPSGSESAHAAPHSLHLDSDTDDEVIPAPAMNEPPVVSAVTDSCTTADAGANDSDTDVEEDSPLVIPLTVTTLSVGPGITLAAIQSDSDADTDVDESSVPPAGDGDNPADLKLDGNTDVEGKEVEQGEAGDDQIPSLNRGNTSGLAVPPMQFSEGEVEEMETQAFLSPSLGPFRRAAAPAVRPVALSSCSDSQEDEDFVVAETQSFILQSRNDHAMDPTQAFGLECSGDERDGQSSRETSFQLGLSDSSHLQCQAQALAMESTQAFVSVGGGVKLEDTQAYASISTADRTSVGTDSNLEATQAYGGNEEPARSPVTLEKEGQVDFALAATQAYISESCNDSGDETDDDERKNLTAAETQPLDFPTSSTLVMAETQPVCAYSDEDLSTETHISSKTQAMKEHREAAQPEERPVSGALSIPETQPMCTSEDEDLMPRPRKRKAKQLEETQSITSSYYSPVETQPMHLGVDETQPVATSGNEESEDEDSISFPRKRKAKQLEEDETQTQTLVNSGVSTAQTQPMDTCEDKESDDEDSIPGPRKKRKAKPLQLEDEQTQPLTSSDVPADETDDEESILGQRKRKAKPLQLEDEETQSLTNSEISTLESQPMRTNTGPQPQRGEGRPSEARTSGISVTSKRGTRARLKEEEKQAESSESPRRQTRGNKAFTTTRGKRQKSKPDESEEEEEAEQAERARGKKSMKQQKDKEEEDETLERNKQQQEEGMLGEEKNDTALRQQEREETEKKKRKIDEQLRLDMEKRELEEMERQQRAERERIERERKEEEEQRLQAEKAERLRLEQERAENERIERERREKEEKERADRILREKEELERKERLECEKAEQEEKERFEKEENERIQRERKEQEEKERLEMAKRAAEEQERLERERKEQEHQARLEMEEKEREEREKLEKEKEKQRKDLQENNDDDPARRTRSRSNSPNSVSSERSTSSVNTQGRRGRGRGRGAKRTSEPPQATISRGNNRRRTVAAEPSDQSQATEQDSNDISPLGMLSRSNSPNSKISICSTDSQNRGRGGRQRGRGRKTVSYSASPISSQGDQNSAPIPTAKGRKSRKAELTSIELSNEDDKEKEDSQQASTTRGQMRASINGPEAAHKEGLSSQEEGCASEHSPLAKRNVRGRGQKALKSESEDASVAPAVSDGNVLKGKRKGRKKELETNAEDAQTAEAAGEEAKDATVQAKRRGRASGVQGSKNPPPDVEVKDESEIMEEEIVERRARGRPSVVQKKKKEVQEESGTCVNSISQDANSTSEPQTPTSGVSRKRQARADSSPVVKTPRSASASPAAGGRLRAASQTYKVLFTGVVDEAGERVLARLGGSMANGVADMNCLVTDKVRRTVKFLCAVAKGVPIVTTHWLEKSGKAGSFLSPNGFVVNDPEQEKKFNFCLQKSLRVASSQPLLQGYAIHVTKSVKPEPVQMKDIISCSGATFLPKMPSSLKPQTVVISCEEDWSLCSPAVSASLPVVTAEFILTGILQQMLDFQTHKLSAPTTNLQPAGGRGRGRKKT